MPATGTRTSSSAICGCDSSTWLSPGCAGRAALVAVATTVAAAATAAALLVVEAGPGPAGRSWFAVWPGSGSGRPGGWRRRGPGGCRRCAPGAPGRSPRSPSRLSARSWRSVRSWRSAARSWRSWRSCRSLVGPAVGVAVLGALLALGAVLARSARSSRGRLLGRLGARRAVLGVASAARLASSGSRRARRGSPVLAGPLSPFWRALMAATRSPLRILAVPLMPMLEASPWSSASRMAVSAPERRGLVPDVASRVVVSVTKDPSPRSWMASIRPIIGSPRRAPQRMAGRRPDRGGRLAAGNGRYPASTAVARPRVAPSVAASPIAAPEGGAARCDSVSRARAPRRARRAVGCRASAPAIRHRRTRTPRRPGRAGPARAPRARRRR